MKRFNVEMAVGIFMVVGFLCFAWLSVKLGDVNLFGSGTYPLNARFGSIAGLKAGAVVEIAGVQVGTVTDIRLNQDDYEAMVEMGIEKGVKITEDSIASIRTAGIIGDRYVNISPGGLPNYLEPGGEIVETESAINFEELISKFIFEKK
jgi:phospholipid/cholesterol/gamma-HCH transport system substrate-binding protein